MEKDDEVKGAGNSYTTEFRQYDPRVGRWLSVDPMSKPDLSSYISMSNNPIIRIDPRGDDDFFNSKGVYLGSTLEGHTIRVVNAEITFEDAQKNIANNTKVLTDFTYLATNLDNRSMLSAIATVYAPVAGINETIRVEEHEIGGPLGAEAFYHPCETRSTPCDDDYFAIAVSTDGLINANLNDAANLTNVLVHEKKHQDDYETHQPLNHTDAVITQAYHTTWQATTREYKHASLKYTAKLLNQAINQGVDMNKINNKIQEIQSSPLGEAGTLFYDEESKSIIPVIELEGVKVTSPKK